MHLRLMENDIRQFLYNKVPLCQLKIKLLFLQNFMNWGYKGTFSNVHSFIRKDTWTHIFKLLQENNKYSMVQKFQLEG